MHAWANMEKMKNLNRGLLVGRFKQNAGAGQPFFYNVDIMVSTVLSNKTKIKKQGLVAHRQYLFVLR